jgi:hypothetical protein
VLQILVPKPRDTQGSLTIAAGAGCGIGPGTARGRLVVAVGYGGRR